VRVIDDNARKSLLAGANASAYPGALAGIGTGVTSSPEQGSSSGVTRDSFAGRVDDIVANIGRLQRGEPLRNVVHGG
jgi:hypothetical protein